jgi:alanyl-tRNA synthetase
MTTQQLLEKYITFFEERGHKKIPNVPLVPENDPTLLFVNSGMFPLVPYFSGEKHPLGDRLVNVQRCIRLDDIEEIGDAVHTTAFHMIGNWGLGSYFKKEQLPWIYEFLVDEVGLKAEKLYASVFAGDEDAPKDEESIELLKGIFSKYGITATENERIFPCNKKHNWWQRGDAVGELGGPDSEVFYYLGEGVPEKGKVPAEHDDLFIEVGNSVFMQYKKTEKGWGELPQKNVDFGGGLERTAMVVQGKSDIFETDSFWPIIEKIQELSEKQYSDDKKSMRILADHMRAAVLLAMDGVEPGNKDQGYILRRLLRRMIRAGKTLGVEKDISVSLVPVAIDTVSWLYPELSKMQNEITKLFSEEEERFIKTLDIGSKQLQKLLDQNKERKLEEWVSEAFNLYQSLGYPQEIFSEDLEEAGVKIDKPKFEELFTGLVEKHQETSRAGSDQKFKGGLADSSDATTGYHTMTHILQAAMWEVLGDHVTQAGSNITDKRLRFDFVHPQKLNEDEIVKLQDWIKEKIDQKLPVKFEILPKEEAISAGAHYMKNMTYPDKVKVYYIGESLDSAMSKEFCGGPHIQNTSELKSIEIYKQENVGKGRVRVYARFVE